MDIESREHIEVVVVKFYERAVLDKQIGHFFAELDLSSHLPRIVDFWDSILLGTQTYSGNPMQVHMKLNKKHSMELIHFNRWVDLWSETVSGMFNGVKAEEAISRAKNIAAVMQLKIKSS